MEERTYVIKHLITLSGVSIKALIQAHGHTVKRRQAQLNTYAAEMQRAAKSAASKAVSQSKVMLEANKLEQNAKEIDELRQQSASDIHDLMARFGHPLVPVGDPHAPEAFIDFNILLNEKKAGAGGAGQRD